MNTMPAGRYYVGDLCYVMHDVWDEVCDLMFLNSYNGRGEYGKFKLKDGREFAVYPTKHGDGSYYDGPGREYWVDAGVIGCILESDIRDPEPTIEGGNIMDFDKDFDTGEDGGMIWFGVVCIDTAGYDDEEEEDYE